MLTSLFIKNFVIIDELTINFKKGLCALTGETGAGKSILIDALTYITGSRADISSVRAGTDKSTLIATFDINNTHPCFKILEENDYDIAPPLILRRILSKDGKSRAFINDYPVSLNFLKKIGQLLLDVQGQFAQSTLFDQKTYRKYIDHFAQNEKLLNEVSDCYKEWKELKDKKAALQEQLDSVKDNEETYKKDIALLKELAPYHGEEDDLVEKRKLLFHQETILKTLTQADEFFTRENGIESLLNNHFKDIERTNLKVNDTLLPLLKCYEKILIEVTEATETIYNLKSNLDYGSTNFDAIDERLYQLRKISKKHFVSVDDLPDLLETLEEKLSSIEEVDYELSRLDDKINKCEETYCSLSKKLTTTRKLSSQNLSKQVEETLHSLNLEKLRFEIKIDHLDKSLWSEQGWDKIDFLISTNPGIPLSPLNKTASGGEISRFLLSLNCVIASQFTSMTLIFDEADTGIGGSVATSVGNKLRQLSQTHQVVVITHTPQVASLAHHHWKIAKNFKQNTTQTSIEYLDKEERINEIARMLSGESITNEALAAAGKLIVNS